MKPTPNTLFAGLLLVSLLGAAAAPAHRRLGFWHFRDPQWTGAAGQRPLGVRNVKSVASFAGRGVQWLAANGAGFLKYRVVEPDGATNLDCQTGTIRLFYQPTWSSKDRSAPLGYGWGNGPGHWVRLLEVGHWTPDASVGLFALSIDPEGTNLVLQTQNDQGQGVTNVAAKISLTYPQPELSSAGPQWHEIVAAYSPSWSALHVDGELKATGLGISFGPPAAVQAQGFAVGSSTQGADPAEGTVAELETFNYPVGPKDLLTTQGADLLTATAALNPPRLELAWRKEGLSHFTLRRKEPPAKQWTILATNLLGLDYVDTNVVSGHRYEYDLYHDGASPGERYLLAGVAATPAEDRGRVILLVDETLAKALAESLAVLNTDLVGDGWTVLRHDVPRHDDGNWARNPKAIARIKALLVADYLADPARTKAIFILGHVAIPYSGYQGCDGHAEHQGAWPADGYYGDVDGLWTDNLGLQDSICPGWIVRGTPSTAPGVLPAQRNVLGDGKFDNDAFPTNRFGVRGLEMSAGRVDFARLPELYVSWLGRTGQSELALLRQYLAKDHRFRQRQLRFADQGIAGSYFGNFEDRDIFLNAWRNVSRCWGLEPERLQEGDLFETRQPCLWGFLAGFGSPDSIRGAGGRAHYSVNFLDPAQAPAVAFYLLDGSYFGDWNVENDLLRSTLAAAQSGLAAGWARYTDWRFESMGLGETLGDGLLRTVNVDRRYGFLPSRTISILGDPTLRWPLTSPPANLTAQLQNDQVVLAWPPSAEPDAAYFVYRASSSSGPFTNQLTPEPLRAGRFADPHPASGLNVYEVRTVNLVSTGSGSFTNLSQGAFAEVTVR